MRSMNLPVWFMEYQMSLRRDLSLSQQIISADKVLSYYSLKKTFRNGSPQVNNPTKKALKILSDYRQTLDFFATSNSHFQYGSNGLFLSSFFPQIVTKDELKVKVKHHKLYSYMLFFENLCK